MPTCNTTTGQWETPVSASDSTVCGKIPDDFAISSPSGIPSCNTITKKWEHYYDRIFIDNTYQVYDMSKKNTLTNLVNGAGLNTETTKVCIEVLAHPNVPTAVNTGYCNDTKNFTSFAGNADWTFVKGKGWIQNAPYDPAVWGAAGIKVKAFWMNATNGTISSSLIEVVSGTSQTSSNNSTSSSPCGPMPTGIGGIQDMPTCGSDGKWRDPSGKVIGGDTNTT